LGASIPHFILKTREELLEVWHSVKAFNTNMTKEECFMRSGVKELVGRKHEVDWMHPCQSIQEDDANPKLYSSFDVDVSYKRSVLKWETHIPLDVVSKYFGSLHEGDPRFSLNLLNLIVSNKPLL
jgi:hypothetical protein